jgi:hypothetical protein
MEIKISQQKLVYLEDIIFDSFGIDNEDWQSPFQSRMGRIEFLTPGTRQDVISRYDKDYNYISVFDDRFYDLVDGYVNRKVYDLIKESLIRKVFKTYTDRFPSIFKEEPKEVKFVDKDYNKV